MGGRTTVALGQLIDITARFDQGQSVYFRIIKLSDKTTLQDWTLMTWNGTYNFYYGSYTFTATGDYMVVVECPALSQSDSTVYDVAGVSITGTSTGSVYCTSTDVARVMNLISTSTGTAARFAFSVSTLPTLAEVNEMIAKATELIDRETYHAWRSTTVTDEYYDFRSPFKGRFLYGSREYRSIKLNHRTITTLSHASGDKLEVYDGSTYTDYITAKTEGRGNDYWVDYKEGIIYFTGDYPLYHKNAVRVTYRYGETTIPQDLRDCCAMIAARDLLMTADCTSLIPSGEYSPTIPDKLAYWDREIQRIIAKHKEILTVYT